MKKPIIIKNLSLIHNSKKGYQWEFLTIGGIGEFYSYDSFITYTNKSNTTIYCKIFSEVDFE